jgi:hypothetical protein
MGAICSQPSVNSVAMPPGTAHTTTTSSSAVGGAYPLIGPCLSPTIWKTTVTNALSSSLPGLTKEIIHDIILAFAPCTRVVCLGGSKWEYKNTAAWITGDAGWEGLTAGNIQHSFEPLPACFHNFFV